MTGLTASKFGLDRRGVLKPGAHAQSVLWLRMSQRNESFMPPIGTKVADQVAADLLAQWIDGIASCPQ